MTGREQEKKKMPPAPQIPVVQGLRSDENIPGCPYKEGCAPLQDDKTKTDSPDCDSCCQFLPDLHFLSAFKLPAFSSFTQTPPEAQESTMAKALCRVQHVGGLTWRGLQSQTGLSVFMILYLSPRS